jgi:hypothetical protein
MKKTEAYRLGLIARKERFNALLLAKTKPKTEPKTEPKKNSKLD